jgi:hypothetical protein
VEVAFFPTSWSADLPGSRKTDSDTHSENRKGGRGITRGAGCYDLGKPHNFL